jgi:hypothetical protein
MDDSFWPSIVNGQLGRMDSSIIRSVIIPVRRDTPAPAPHLLCSQLFSGLFSLFAPAPVPPDCSKVVTP